MKDEDIKKTQEQVSFLTNQLIERVDITYNNAFAIASTIILITVLKKIQADIQLIRR